MKKILEVLDFLWTGLQDLLGFFYHEAHEEHEDFNFLKFGRFAFGEAFYDLRLFITGFVGV